MATVVPMSRLQLGAALVSGGGSGIGADLSLALAERSVAVTVRRCSCRRQLPADAHCRRRCPLPQLRFDTCPPHQVQVADIDGAAAAKVAGQIRQRGGRAISVQCDVSDSRQHLAAFQAHQAAWGRLDYALLNAGGCWVGAGSQADQRPAEPHRRRELRTTRVASRSARRTSLSCGASITQPCACCHLKPLPHCIPPPGIGERGDLVWTRSGNWRQTLDIDLTAVAEGVRLATRAMVTGSPEGRRSPSPGGGDDGPRSSGGSQAPPPIKGVIMVRCRAGWVWWWRWGVWVGGWWGGGGGGGGAAVQRSAQSVGPGRHM